MQDDRTPRLDLPLIQPAQAQKHVTHNEALAQIEIAVQPVLEGLRAATPPEAPAEGAIWDVGPDAAGDWAGQAGRLAMWLEGWRFVTPREGWRAWDRPAGRAVVHDGIGWVQETVPPPTPPESLPRLGVNAAADDVDRLSVSATSTLLTHEGGDHRLKVNKAAAVDTASLLFQSGWSGRAEMGLAGSDDFAVKVSADGAAWTTALAVSGATGRVSGAAVQAGATDDTPGRLMTTGAFGLGTAVTETPPIVPLNAAAVPGLYSYLYTDAAAPTPNSGMVLVQRYSTSYLRQTARRISAWDVYERYSANGGSSWSAWRTSYGAANVLGPVSQANGVPTGALIERGSGANGSYVRHADGRQECLIGTATFARADDDALAFAWTFPAPFAAGTRPIRTVAFPAAAADWTGVAPGAMGAVLLGTGHAAAETRIARVAGAPAFAAGAQVRNCAIVATGRWY